MAGRMGGHSPDSLLVVEVDYNLLESRRKTVLEPVQLDDSRSETGEDPVVTPSDASTPLNYLVAAPALQA